MEIYKIPIKFAIITFPFIAFILTIPFLIYQYRKYGAIPMLKSLIFYSFILYLISAYYMVILPLPSMEYVSSMTTPYLQLHPFQFIRDIIVTIPKGIDNVEAFLKVFNLSTIYTVLFNFVLTLPFGVYLRYYFNKKWYQTIVISFILSLFFEITQLSGLYGIYPRPYRLFDIDDLIINTLGGLFGHIITPIFMLFLPSQKELESKSYIKGKKVSIVRRTLSTIIDAVFITIINFVILIFTYNTRVIYYANLLSILIYYIIIPLLGSGKTIGKKILQISVITNNEKLHTLKIISRYLLLSLFIIYPNTIPEIMETLKINSIIINIVKTIIIIFILSNVFYYLFISKGTNKKFLYEKITGTKNISTIIYNEEIEEIKEEKKLSKEKKDMI